MIKKLINLVTGVEKQKTNGNKRSSEWPKVRANHLKKHPTCEVCGGIRKIEVHHIKPFHLNSELELDENNLISLCENNKWLNCHLAIGHLGNFKSYNVDVINDAKNLLNKIKNRPK